MQQSPAETRVGDHMMDWLTVGRSRDQEKFSTFSEYIGPSWVDWSNNLLLLEYNE